MAELIDWPVSGAARLVHAAAGVDPADRLELVRRGVAGLTTAAESDRVQLLGTDVAYLNERPELLPSTEAENDRIRSLLRVGPLPEGIAPSDREVLARLAELAESVTDTAVLRFAGDRDWGLAVGAFERVALVRGLTDRASAT